MQAEWRCRYTHTKTHGDHFNVQFLWRGTAPLWLSSFESRGEGWGSRSSTAVLDPTLLDAQNNWPSIALTYFALHKLYHSPIIPHAQTLFITLESFPVWKCYEKVSHNLTHMFNNSFKHIYFDLDIYLNIFITFVFQSKYLRNHFQHVHLSARSRTPGQSHLRASAPRSVPWHALPARAALNQERCDEGDEQ